MRKIVVFFESVLPTNNAASIRAWYFLNELVNKKIYDEVTVITGTPEPEPIDGVRFITVNSDKSYSKRHFLKRAFDEFVLGVKASLAGVRQRNVSCFYISSPSYIASSFFSLTLILFNKRYFYEVRDIYPEAYACAGIISEKSLIYKLLQRMSVLIYRRSMLVITATKGLEAEVKKKCKVGVFNSYNGFPGKMLSINESKFSEFTVVFHGTLGVFQNIEVIEGLAAKLSGANVNIIIIGHGSKDGLAKKLSVEFDNVDFLGSLGHDDVIRIVSKCHLGLSLRFTDSLSMMSFPVKNWEYLGLGLPSVVSPSDSEAALFLQENRCGLVTDNDPDQIGDMILMLKENPEAYAMLRESCLLSRGQYTRERLSRELVETISSI